METESNKQSAIQLYFSA